MKLFICTIAFISLCSFATNGSQDYYDCLYSYEGDTGLSERFTLIANASRTVMLQDHTIINMRHSNGLTLNIINTIKGIEFKKKYKNSINEKINVTLVTESAGEMNLTCNYVYGLQGGGSL